MDRETWAFGLFEALAIYAGALVLLVIVMVICVYVFAGIYDLVAHIINKLRKK